MKSIISLFIALLLSFTALLHSQVPQGDRILSWTVDVSENQTYDDAFATTLSQCAQSIHMQYVWGSFETDAGEFDEEVMTLFDISNIYFPFYNMPLELNIGTMNTTINDIPADLVDLPYDSPILIDRFKAFLDTMFAHIPDVEMVMLSIGNESDIFMGTDAQKYEEYKTFLNEVIPYAKQKYLTIHGSDVEVGTTLTHNALVDANKGPLCHLLNDGLDIVSTTYYPLEGLFLMSDPSVVSADFNSLVDEYPDVNQPIYFTECGYASSEVCNSSESNQAEFFEEVFTSWDEHYVNIKLISIFKLADWSQAQVNELGEYYMLDNPAFLEYLRTLGVRTYEGNGTDKEAFETITCALEVRNWCATVECTTGIIPVAQNEIVLYPNPAADEIFLELKNNITRVSHVLVMDISGKKMDVKVSKTNKGLKLDVNYLNPGMYFVEVLGNRNILKKTFIVE